MSRLLVLTNNFPVLSQTFVTGHLDGMAQRGWEVAVVSTQVDHQLKEQMYPGGSLDVHDLSAAKALLDPKSRVIRKSINKLAMARYGLRADHDLAPWFNTSRGRSRVLKLFKLINQLQPDVIHAQFGPLGLFAAPVCNKLNIPLLVNFRGYDFTRWPLENGWSQYDFLPKNTVLICHTEFCRNVLAKHIDRPIEFIRRGVNRDLFYPADKADQWPDAIKMIIAGRLDYKKGTHHAIDALALLKKMLPDKTFELTIAGGGEGADALMTRAAMLGVDSQVHITGEISHDHIASLMVQSDIQLIPSLPGADGWVENFCTVASEGLASGLCVVGANIGGIPEAIEGVGIVVPAASSYELARGVMHGVEQHSPAEWSERSVARAQKYSDAYMMDDYESLTSRVMDGSYG